MRVLFRCDSSLVIGTGHVMRCRNLARALQKRGVEVLFLCREVPGDLISLLAQEFLVLGLPALRKPEQCYEGLEGRNLYGAWLGCSQSQDAEDCLSAIRLEDPGAISWLVVDHYGIDQEWEDQVCKGLSEIYVERPRLLVFDDLADRPHQADVLVDANRLDTNAGKSYQHNVPSTCRLLLGPTFAPLDPLYGELKALTPQRCKLQRVLVFFGGVDKENHTEIALRALAHPDFADLSVDVVIGTAAPHHAKILELVEERAETQLHSGLPNLAGLMVRADLAIGAAGTTSWERAALGLPTLVTPVADNQRQSAQALADAGAALLISLEEAPDPGVGIHRAIRAMQSEPELLQHLSTGAGSVADGRGLGRLTTAICGPNQGLRLRPATPGDEGLYLNWANETEVRRQSFNEKPITMEEHQHWFRNRLHSPDALLRVLVDFESLPLGQIRFERSNIEPDKAIVGFSLDPVARGFGLSSELLRLGLAEVAREWDGQVHAYGEVRNANLASAKAFLRAGFDEGSAPRLGVRCFTRSAARVI